MRIHLNEVIWKIGARSAQGEFSGFAASLLGFRSSLNSDWGELEERHIKNIAFLAYTVNSIPMTAFSKP